MVMTRSRSRRDWLSLPPDLVARIAYLLLSDDLTHFVRLRAVCRSWRLFTAVLKSRADVFLPRDWILLSASERPPANKCKTKPQRFDFFNVASGKSFSTFLPLLHRGYALYSPVNCLLLLNKNKKKADGTMALLNPFTGFLVQLPSTVVSTCGKPPLSLSNALIGGYATSTAALFFLMHYPGQTRLVWKRPGQDTWFYADAGISCFDYFFDKDFLYGIDFDRGLVRINLVLADEIAADPIVEILAPFPKIPSDEFVETANIFNCDGTIVLVLFPNDRSGDYLTYEKYGVLELDTEKMKFVYAEDINDYAIFISRENNLSVSCKKLASIPGNSVFFCGLIGADDVVRYDVLRDMPEPYSPRSGTCAGRLIKYCFDGKFILKLFDGEFIKYCFVGFLSNHLVYICADSDG